MRTRLALVVLLMSGTLVAGCTERPDAPEDPTPPPPDDTPPPPLPSPLFDGAAAYDLALAQLYDEPATHTGPRYRIPGTPTSAAVAAELWQALSAALAPQGGTATLSTFTGADYYDLDHGPVRTFLCGSDDPTRDRVATITFRNVVGRTDPDAIGLIIGAHWDSKRHADNDPDPERRDDPILGADDGAGATAAVIELARVFTHQDPGIPLTFVLFDGEDGFARDDCHPLAGSLHFAQNLDAPRDTVLGMVLLDMIGNASATYYREGNSMRYHHRGAVLDSSWLGDAVWAAADRLNITSFADERTGAVIDDHLAFLHEGIPSLDVIRYEHGFAPYWHTTKDDHTAISAEGLQQVGRAVELAVHTLARDRWADA